MRRAVMRYAVVPLLLSACATVPEDPAGTGYYGGSTLGPYGLGYAPGPAGPCSYASNPAFMGPPYPGSYGSSYNCAAPLLFYARSAYAPYHPVSPPVVTHHHRHHSSGAGHAPGTTPKSSGHRGRRK